MYKVHPAFLLILGLAVGLLGGIFIVRHDALTGGGTYIPKYEPCQSLR